MNSGVFCMSCPLCTYQCLTNPQCGTYILFFIIDVYDVIKSHASIINTDITGATSVYVVTSKVSEFISCVRAGANESQKTRNKKQNGLAHSRFIVCVTPKQKKNIA